MVYEFNYFALEGPDGVGKSIQTALLYERLMNAGYPVTVVREPGGTVIGERIREVMLPIKDSISILPMTTLLLMNACRHELMFQVIEPALQRGDIVLSDRCFFSSDVFQGHVEGLENDTRWVRELCKRSVGWRQPSKVFLIDMPVEDIIRRLANVDPSKKNRYDLKGAEFHGKIREGYLNLVKDCPYDNLIEVIDGTQPIGVINDHIFNRIVDLNR